MRDEDTARTAWNGSWGNSGSSLFDYMDFLAWWKCFVMRWQPWARGEVIVYEGSERKPKR